MRASDADRDRIADQLREALAEGRLTSDEHAERLDAAYKARTYAELAPIVHDLPVTGGTPSPHPSTPPPRSDLPMPASGSPNITVVFSGAQRKGRWLVEPQTNVSAVFGGVELDLREAVLSQREVTINVVAIMGGVSIQVPPGIRVKTSVNAVFGGCTIPDEDTLDPNAPVLHLTGLALFGGVDVKRSAGHVRSRERRRELRDERRHRRRALGD
jgi:hypothetical protein